MFPHTADFESFGQGLRGVSGYLVARNREVRYFFCNHLQTAEYVPENMGR